MKQFLIAMPLLLLLGCGSGNKTKAKTVDVSGRVTLNGQPLAGALVSFSTSDFSAAAETDDDGKYTLPQGAAVGENHVTISKIKGDAGFSTDPEDGMDAGQLEAAQDPNITGKKSLDGEQLPAKYSDPEKSILKYIVTEGGTDAANFNLM